MVRAASETIKAPDQALLYERVSEGIRRLILSGEFKPGSRIGQEDLAARFGTSRIPVREALRRLESDGLVMLVPNSGARVAKLDLRECVEVYKMRERIEPLAIAESVARITDDQIAKLERLVERIKLCESAEEFLKLDRQFHLACYQAAGMHRLLATVERFWNTTQHYRRAFVGLFGPKDDWVTHYEHALLVAAMKRRDATEAERILGGHIRRTRLELERHRELFQTNHAATESRRVTAPAARRPSLMHPSPRRARSATGSAR
jgi:DNA-binding GntR family transcriptional regulator